MRGVVALVLALALGSCGGGTSLRLLAPDELPPDLYATASPSRPAAPTSVLVHFISNGRLAPVERQAEGSTSALELALRELLAGPTQDERLAGIDSAIPDGVQLLAASVSRGTAVVSVSKELELGAEQRVLLLRLAQVVYTATGLRGVSGVRFLVDGNPVDVLGDDGQPRRGAVGRDDYKRVAPPEP